MASQDIEQFQQQTRDLLKAQQDTFVAAVKTWREAVAAATAAGTPPPPSPVPPPLGTLPTPTEMAEATYAFAAKLLADQSRFMEELSKVVAAPAKKG
jgi:uncharacterized coiled-coil protein SlyX